MSDHQMKVEGARIAGATAGITLYGITLNEWVAVATIIYLAVQILILLPKAYDTMMPWIHRRAAWLRSLGGKK